MSTHDPTLLPEELRDIESDLCRLGEHERATTPPGLQDRLADVTRPYLRPVLVHPTVVRTRGRRLLTPMRLAATLALGSAVLAVWLSSLRPLHVAPELARYESLDLRVESLLAWNSPLGEGFAGLGERIDLLFAELSAVNTDPATDWAADPALLDGGAL